MYNFVLIKINSEILLIGKRQSIFYKLLFAISVSLINETEKYTFIWYLDPGILLVEKKLQY